MNCTSSQEENPEGELGGPGLDQMGNITVKQRHPSSPMASPPIFDDQSGHPQIKSRTSPYFHPGDFCIFLFQFLIFFHPGHGDATSSTGNPFFANQFYPFQPGFSGHKMASDPLSRFLWLFSLKLLLFPTGRLLQKGGMLWMCAVCNSRLNLTLSYQLQPASSVSHSFDQNEISQN